ncbi:Endoglucanase [Aphelenchoides bicaudatus]|nr:Endoglucanase [Aphelenchoides bicaudatus]
MIGVFLCALVGAVQAVAPPYGQLSVKGTKLVGSDGSAVALHGMSLFWSQWAEGTAFYNNETIQALKCSWNANVVRAAMAVDQGGYLTEPTVEQGRVETVIQAAIGLGIYVIVDWHDSDAQDHADQAVTFFSAISKKYASYPNIIYEIYNEPLQVDWTTVIKPYHEKVVAAIRANDPNNVIVLGTPTWSQDVDVAAANPVSGNNLMYTLHYYAATHKQSLRDKAQTALNAGIGIFVTEYGTVDASGGGSVDTESSNEWYTFLDANQISYANWAIDNKAEAAAALNPGTTSSQVGDDSVLTASGQLVKAKLKSQNNGVSCSGSSNTNAAATTTVAGSATTKSSATTTKAASNSATSTAASGTSSGVSISIATVNSWDGGAQYQLVFKNTGSKAVCGANFNIVLGSGITIASSWNFSPVSGTQYTLPSWVNIQPSASFQDAGFITSGGSAVPSKMNSKKFTELLLTSKPSMPFKRYLSDKTIGSTVNGDQKMIGYWLLGCAGLSAGGLALGGLTRLSEGKFNMFNWDLRRTYSVPRSDKAWQEEFEACQKSK